MDKLDDFLLIEILRRLPSAKSAFQCKLVCPHWNSLISSTHFSTRFLDHHPEKHLAIISSQHISTRHTYRFLSNDSNFQDFDYNFALCLLKSTPSNHRGLDVEILATYNELLLCLHQYRCLDAHAGAYNEIMKFYIYSPLTKHHVALPPSPLRPQYSSRAVVGFLCRGGQSSFRVVHIFGPWHGGDSFTVHIFSSEENEWMEHSLSAGVGKIINHRHVVALAWKGLLCWKSDKGNRIVFCNPYSSHDRKRFHFIATPPESQGLGVFQETLRLWDLRRGMFRVWDLKDCNTGGEWSLKYQVRPDRCNITAVVAFDPNDEDVVYFESDKKLFPFDMRSGDSSLVDLSLKTSINIPRNLSGGSINVLRDFLMLVMSGFPTPITAFPQNAIATDTIALPFDRITRSRTGSLQKAKKLDK